MRVADRVAIVTGGGQGIGEGIVRCLAKEGADVAVIDIIGDNAKRVANEVISLGRKALAIEADLTQKEKVVNSVRDVLRFLGRVDILVNNVGGYPTASLEAASSLRIVDRSDEEWDYCYQINFKTQVMMCQAVMPHMARQRSGKIINIASDGARLPAVQLVSYAAAKAALVHYTRILARDLAQDNINVNCICPGVVSTPLLDRVSAAFTRVVPSRKSMTPQQFFDDVLVAQVPLGRPQTPEDIGHAVVFFASEEAKNITGQTLSVDGGMAFV